MIDLDILEVYDPLRQLLDKLGLDEDQDWQKQAVCLDQKVDLFFPERGANTQEAKKICAACIVRSECLEYALENNIKEGVFGGMSTRDRRRIARARTLGAYSAGREIKSNKLDQSDV